MTRSCRTFAMTNLVKIGLLCLAIYASSATLGTSEKAFEIFKGLQGTWAILSEGKTLRIQMSYEVASNGSIVTEQFGRELSVLYLDRGSVQMIHFCNAGNQPRLKLKDGGRPDLLTFEIFDITNLKSTNTAHVEKIIYKIISANKLDLEILWREGNSQRSEIYILTKI